MTAKTCLENMIELTIGVRPILVTEGDGVFHQASQVDNDHAA